jgi:hypothetical protein
MSEEKVIAKVVARLTDLRLTLGPEERFVLDRMIVGEKAEVTGHKFEVGGGWGGKVILDNEEYKVEL